MAGNRILWIEDDPDVIDAVGPRLEEEGWRLTTASSAAEGKRLAAERKPDLIIMDIIMPGEHGFSAIEDLKSSAGLADVPVVIFTSVTHRWKETSATRRDGMLTEAEAFVDKADGPELLVETVRKYLQG
ncbi:MAG: response regulator [Lentisphaerae bacterium]|nr:response regulator [Lentisphaerota bacterium]